jgi:hypothetical protein
VTIDFVGDYFVDPDGWEDCCTIWVTTTCDEAKFWCVGQADCTVIRRSDGTGRRGVGNKSID